VYTYNREPFKHFKRATEKTVISCVRVGVIVNPKLCRKKIKIPYTVINKYKMYCFRRKKDCKEGVRSWSPPGPIKGSVLHNLEYYRRPAG
jgi:hypothetical protein